MSGTGHRVRAPAIVLFSGEKGRWHRVGSLSTAFDRSEEVVVAWEKGKESIFYLDRKKSDRTDNVRSV